jgi:hypothetical protein
LHPPWVVLEQRALGCDEALDLVTSASIYLGPEPGSARSVQQYALDVLATGSPVSHFRCERETRCRPQQPVEKLEPIPSPKSPKK